ncbi:hypothetical protein [Allokutzneria oryzae]|uniref:Uncharacterized protein n=1 Tax=Allokutzneria oryzae TaxID=1378989 RepID=A0ABV5ZVJ2_9PSEU
MTGVAQASERNILGPTGYKGIELGASEAQAVATGLLVDGEGGEFCRRYYFAPTEGTMPRASGVFISGSRGVTLIGGTSRMRTNEGVGRGSKLADAKRVYPDLTRDPEADWLYTSPVPGNKDAKYKFVVLNDIVDDFSLESNDRGGC